MHVRCVDCREGLAMMEDSSVHMVLTDPPYFYAGGGGDDWTEEAMRPPKRGVVSNLNVGMSFGPKQGRNLQEFMAPVAEQLLRVLKPGGFVACFSAPRMSHRMAVAFEDAGFEVRDQMVWNHGSGQYKAFKMNQFITEKKYGDRREEVLAAVEGRVCPMPRPMWESIHLFQRPREGTFVDNWMKHRVGLMDGEHYPCNRFDASKPQRKDAFNDHPTVKPLETCMELIRMFTLEGQTVLDPFAGSGTTLLAAKKMRRNAVGFERESKYVDIIERRLEQ